MEGKTTIIAIIVVVIFVGIFGFTYLVKAGMINFGVKQTIAQIDSAGEIIDKTYDATNAIYNYEWFKTQYEKIKAAEKQIDNTAMQVDEYKELFGPATEWDFQTKEEYSRLSTVLLGQKNQYETLVAEYNARSKQANRNIFKDSLPFNVDKKMW